MSSKQRMTLIVEGKYHLDNKIGEGAFGKIFSGVNKNTNHEVAVKIEKKSNVSPLRNEARIYTALRDVKGIPKMRAWGTEGKFNYLVVDLLGETLEQRRQIHGGSICLKDVLGIGIQMLERITDIHKCGLIHRDVKPANFIYGKNANDTNMLYIIDFGLAKVYRHNREHVSKRGGRMLLGTARFVSINTHNGISPSRRDDIESIGYVMIYLLLGELPWQGISCDTEQEKHLIGELKKKINLWDLSREKGIPEEIIFFIEHARMLDYSEEPDYSFLSNLLLKCR